jgi:beta-ribofuranosylaminobenzene 5'-phosphate synthase
MALMLVRDPAFVASVLPAEEQTIGAAGDFAVPHEKDIAEFLEALRESWQAPPVRLLVEQALPEHTGFGSKTTTLLAIGKAYALLVGRTASTAELARVGGRAGTSGASVNLIDRGGFLVDGGHANPPDFDEDPRKYLVPSRYAGSGRKPPVLINLEFPPWPILLFTGVGTKLSGQPELEWFHRTMPIPLEEARRTAHEILMHLAPAIAEQDYPAFCRALNVITYETHYKREQVAVQSEEMKALIERARAESSLDAVGMSVTGPACFAFTTQPHEAVAWLESMRSDGLVLDWAWTCAQNHPVVLEGVPA